MSRLRSIGLRAAIAPGPSVVAAAVSEQMHCDGDHAEVISPNPAALQLRYLQTLTEVGVNQNSTIVFPLPLDVIRPFLESAGATPAEGSERPQPAERGVLDAERDIDARVGAPGIRVEQRRE